MIRPNEFSFTTAGRFDRLASYKTYIDQLEQLTRLLDTLVDHSKLLKLDLHNEFDFIEYGTGKRSGNADIAVNFWINDIPFNLTITEELDIKLSTCERDKQNYGLSYPIPVETIFEGSVYNNGKWIKSLVEKIY